jgi:hypothetical protein
VRTGRRRRTIHQRRAGSPHSTTLGFTLSSVLLRRFRRPLAAFRWPLVVILAVPWLILIFAQSCREAPAYPEVTLATATICIALWANHARSGPATSLRVVGKIVGFAVYDLVSLALLLLLLAVPLAVVFPHYDCYTPRAKMSEVFLSASPIRNEIGERFARTKTLRDVAIDLRITPTRRVAGGYVTADGVILLASEDPPAIVIFMPQTNGSTLTWKCQGFPRKVMPLPCRE